ncbi:pantoate--beta-alanine ligase [Streptoalloteichus tenebrarius]|uniref:Pantothenate synthetase n=1 Tax=Streptoalloteichus tenebrarius (strain ATCC 17920 / DSM 40477 / JCM 4838 / CBS 697.72 / NBRC 16177 / NCIMB 11028 / NRRL B-12390 / A12253. 1 / ISP 5477) TaxID=1933 RepID=A0ABT1I3F8_STRSD|nr:pantoate--beta-alanine ligase [Streptoalloteichus tenebrarius]MCP2262284.1 pantoate--beta-alanine ligase [Streptoalloteichus tenebrarius]BFF01577.1 pantoate--beta-alanine ligase [Streptoalloteichus tenebrarius]
MTPNRPGNGYTPGELTVHHDPAELGRVTRALRTVGRRIVLVPTMGALHEGHRELVRRARRIPNAVVVVSIFVNPLQFGPNEDFDRYPRTLDADVEACRAEGVELVFAPTPASMYPEGRRTTVRPGPLGEELEGAFRPGFFTGVLTVVAKLFNVVRPDMAFFGEKDYQQLVLVRQMVRDLDMDVRVVGIPTVRDGDGLALSSRNAYLSDEERTSALALSAALSAGAHAGAGGAEAVLSAARAVLAADPLVEVDYLELRGLDLGPAPETGEARLLVAARVGATRLIDNCSVLLGAGVDGTPDGARGTTETTSPTGSTGDPAALRQAPGTGW